MLKNRLQEVCLWGPRLVPVEGESQSSLSPVDSPREPSQHEGLWCVLGKRPEARWRLHCEAFLRALCRGGDTPLGSLWYQPCGAQLCCPKWAAGLFCLPAKPASEKAAQMAVGTSTDIAVSPAHGHRGSLDAMSSSTQACG